MSKKEETVVKEKLLSPKVVREEKPTEVKPTVADEKAPSPQKEEEKKESPKQKQEESLKKPKEITPAQEIKLKTEPEISGPKVEEKA